MNSKQQIESLDCGLLVRAPAKINLSLLISGRRPDGFHEIRTIMAKVNWYDELLFAPGDKEGIEFVCTGKEPAPAGPDNLVYRACRLASQKASVRPNVRVTLTKNIPAGTGLGSASSDAAAALIGLNRFAKLNISRQDLTGIAARLGSDVPFFLGPPLALCTGRGEKIKKIKKNFDFSAILMLPNVNVATKKVYNDYKHNAGLFKKLNAAINKHLEKNSIDLISLMCANMLAETSFGLYKELADFKRAIGTLGIGGACLSGSGSAMFYMFRSGESEKAKQCQQLLDNSIGCKTVLVNNNRW